MKGDTNMKKYLLFCKIWVDAKITKKTIGYEWIDSAPPGYVSHRGAWVPTIEIMGFDTVNEAEKFIEASRKKVIKEL
jgi:hypothetical protein